MKGPIRTQTGVHSIADLAEMFFVSRPTVYWALERTRATAAAGAS
jgi:transposase